MPYYATALAFLSDMSIGNAIKRTVTAALQDSNRIGENETIEQVRSIGGGKEKHEIGDPTRY